MHKETQKGSKGQLTGKREAKWISDFRLLMIRYDTILKSKLEHEGAYETLPDTAAALRRLLLLRISIKSASISVSLLGSSIAMLLPRPLTPTMLE
jgi:hypothetical protein